jgi:mRNA interferase HigB
MRRLAVTIISRQKIIEAYQRHSEWKASLESWYKITESAKWQNFPEVKATFNSADSVGTCVVFNISHNRCRLISRINYKSQVVYILSIHSHADYSKGRWKNACDCD